MTNLYRPPEHPSESAGDFTGHQPFVSIIVPVFNREALVGRCIRSLLSQTMHEQSYEIVVVDDGSTDRTAFSVSLFQSPRDPQVRLIRHETNGGLPAALNTGIRASRGELIVRVDSDDFVSNHFLLSLFLYMKMNPNSAAVECDYELVDDSESVIERVNATSAPIGCGIMFRKHHMLRLGLYNEALRSDEEKEFRARFEQEHRIEHIALPLYRYRQHLHGRITQP